jgi:anti-sigma regulatory factor (Ser/Thr protein kinase)
MASKRNTNHGHDAPRGRSLRVRIPPNARCSGNVRHQVLSFAGNHEINNQELEEFIFAVGEALANAIEHSRTSDVIEVHCQIEDDKILATIVDSGAGFALDPLANIALPDAFNERGRGLPIMRRCTDIFAVHSVPGRGTAVVLGRYLRRKANADQERVATS